MVSKTTMNTVLYIKRCSLLRGLNWKTGCRKSFTEGDHVTKNKQHKKADADTLFTNIDTIPDTCALTQLMCFIRS